LGKVQHVDFRLLLQGMRGALGPRKKIDQD
jgi:hypothetical protein